MPIKQAQIDQWIRDNTRFEGKADGAGLMLRYRAEDKLPVWRFRYRMSDGKQRQMTLGNIDKLPLMQARKMATLLNAEVILGKDPQGERQERRREALRKREGVTINALLQEYYDTVVLRDWKDPVMVQYRMSNIRDNIGTMKAADVRPGDIDAMLKVIVARGAPSMAKEALLWSKRLFRWANTREYVTGNPAEGFDKVDAGGKAHARERWLTEAEMREAFRLMRESKAFGVTNRIAITLLLALMVRKDELTSAKKAEFDLEAGEWTLPKDRTKTEAAMVIPLPPMAVSLLQMLMDASGSSKYLIPARLWRETATPMGAGTLNIALNAHVRPLMAGEPWVVHDLRRTGRTWLSKLGVDFMVAERCLNHKPPGIVGTYDRHDWLPQRRAALEQWATMLESLGALEGL